MMTIVMISRMMIVVLPLNCDGDPMVICFDDAISYILMVMIYFCVLIIILTMMLIIILIIILTMMQIF